MPEPSVAAATKWRCPICGTLNATMDPSVPDQCGLCGHQLVPATVGFTERQSRRRFGRFF
ncbi:hypothetical protein FOS14_12665 [Skermania sp. ID1734]|uniref:hypothetical protein n=1 Tax=Skermania sp. ID1734 TaxID=2597516 RepID=UPI00117C8087|nr:hypothetical protein [Skermania sp. ID1734]TSD99212.1 hypothetical protein FOS14_12665 [Skermania sp. ID1734]